MTAPASCPKDILGLHGLDGETIVAILEEAAGLRDDLRRRVVRTTGGPDRPGRGGPLDLLAGRTVCLLFFEPSTRTMNAFANR